MSALLERRAREHHQQELAMSSAPAASPMSCASRVTETWHGQAADAVYTHTHTHTHTLAHSLSHTYSHTHTQLIRTHTHTADTGVFYQAR